MRHRKKKSALPTITMTDSYLVWAWHQSPAANSVCHRWRTLISSRRWGVSEILDFCINLTAFRWDKPSMDFFTNLPFSLDFAHWWHWKKNQLKIHYGRMFYIQCYFSRYQYSNDFGIKKTEDQWSMFLPWIFTKSLSRWISHIKDNAEKRKICLKYIICVCFIFSVISFTKKRLCFY